MSLVQTTELLVGGYIREAHELWDNEIIIPSTINPLCVQYLHQTFWYFSSDNIWTLYNQKDQAMLNEAIQHNQTHCKLDDGSSVIFINHFQGYRKANDAAVVHGQPEVYGTCVIENGSASIKAGFVTPSTDDGPVSRVPNMVAAGEYDTCYIGDNALEHKDELTLSQPIKDGVVQNWEHMESFWRYLMEKELSISKSNVREHAVLMSESPWNPKAAREKSTEIMFETFNVPAFYLAIDAVLALYSAGRMYGAVLDCGHASSHSVAVWDGYSLGPYGTARTSVGGTHIDEYLAKLLKEKECVLNEEQIRDLKESLCYVALNYDDECMTKSKELKGKEYRLPDGQVIVCKEELFRCTETLFRPDLAGLECSGIQEILSKSVKAADHDRLDLFKNIVCCGGSVRFAGFKERIHKEMLAAADSLALGRHKPAVYIPEHAYPTWTGGAILASLPSFRAMWIQSDEYREFGPSIVHRKCF